MKKKVFIAGHNGMVGSALVRLLSKEKGVELITRSRDELDLIDQASVWKFFATTAVDEVYLSAATVGGIHANNTYPAKFIYDNLMIAANVINSAHCAEVQKMLFFGSSCIYPKHADQPIQEGALLSGALEPTNEPYAVAKIAGLKMCASYNKQYGRDYRSIMPTNLYGPGDNFHSENSHVVPALMRRFHEAAQNNASSVTVWGSGLPLREFLHVDDLALASVFIAGLERMDYQKLTGPSQSHLNVGCGQDVSIKELARLVAEVTGFSGEVIFDSNKPDGTKRKVLDMSKLYQIGWRPKIDLQEGLTQTYQWFLNNTKNLRS
nr:GDP-L-fucose synthase [Luminiphilus sp.]